jgi:hypothetical protein
MIRKPMILSGLVLTGIVLTGSAPPPSADSLHRPEPAGASLAHLVPALVLPVSPSDPPRVARKGPRGALDDETRAFLISTVGGGTSRASGSRVSPGDPP